MIFHILLDGICVISTCILTENIYILMRCFHDFQFQKAIIQVLICPWTETILRTVSSQTGKYHFQLRIKTRMKNIKSVNNENVKIHCWSTPQTKTFSIYHLLIETLPSVFYCKTSFYYYRQFYWDYLKMEMKRADKKRASRLEKY